MSNWLLNTLGAIGSILLSLTITLIFNRLVGIPKELKKQRELAKQKEEQLKQENLARDAKIAVLESAINALPGYRAQSLQIQTKLQDTDKEILIALTDIKKGIRENQDVLNTRLDRLEDREKNAIRA